MQMHPLKYTKVELACSQKQILETIFDSIREISSALRHSPVVQLQTQNKFGDTQLHQDVHCDKIIQKHLRLNPKVIGFASEQRPELQMIRQFNQKGYFVTYDPLDGSSIIDTNFTVGSIFSIWPCLQSKLIGSKISAQKNAVLALYGPRTTLIFYNSILKKVQQLTLVQNEWVLSHENLVIKPKTKIFSPGNLRAVNDNNEYKKVVQSWIDRQYTLRYTGGLVPDVAQIFVKRHGIFANISSPKHKAKLRVLYEVAAVGYLIQKAEGATLTQGNISLLNYQIQSYDDKISFACGSKDQLNQMFKNIF